MSRIAVLGPVHPLRGGIALHTARWAAALRDVGHEVRVFSFARQYPSILFPGTSQFDAGDPVCDLGEPPPEAILDSVGPWTWQAAIRALRDYRPEVLVVQRWHPFFAPVLSWVARAMRADGVRVVWMVHNAQPHDGPDWLWKPLARLGYAPEDLCLVHAASEARALRSLGVAGRIETIEHPAPTELEVLSRESARGTLKMERDETVFLFFGHVRPYKGVEVFLEALTGLVNDPRPWRAMIVGEWYYDRTAANAYVEKEGLIRQVHLVDAFVSEREVAMHFAAANVVVLPYRAGTQSGVVPQAFAFGRPVIVSDVGAVAAAVRDGETGLVIPPNDPDALRGALLEILDGREFSTAAIAESCAAASWQPMVSAVADVTEPEGAARPRRLRRPGGPRVEA